ncbi:MAG TPA: hypothetical protein VME43_11880 [Bryobacteraceae bacterium]|nr:hypothetical protein [Bryobacteraceae bacterium]
MVLTRLRPLAWLLLAAALPARADLQFRVQPAKPTQAPIAKGQCDIRLRVSGEAEVSLRGDVVSVHTISGHDARNDGSVCNQPLPDRDVRGFAFKAKESRGEVRLVAPPSEANDFQAVVHISDTAPGEGRYDLRLNWDLSAAGMLDERQAGPPGFVWNNATRYKTRGAGQADVGDVHLALLDVDVAIDLGGKAWVTFHTANKQALSFSGVINDRQPDRLRADVVCDGPLWHVQGPMFLSIDDAHNRVTAITLDATDGRDRLHLSWNWKRR